MVAVWETAQSFMTQMMFVTVMKGAEIKATAVKM